MDKKSINNSVKAEEIASLVTDPKFVAALRALPNPDHVLRRLGRDQEVYDAIMADAHVIGEVRSKRNGLFAWEYALQPGGDDPASKKAFELAQKMMDEEPSAGTSWHDVFWNICWAIYGGYSVHELLWDVVDGALLPVAILDRDTGRFRFGTKGELRILTKANRTDGEELPEKRFLVARHMPKQKNPYGIALLSSCYWPWVFKHGGMEFFAKFCERYGFPWPVGKYPQGADDAAQNELLDNLAQMVEDSVAVIPDNASVELHEAKGGGTSVHERLIKVMNAEISKALSQQTLATELDGEGSRAAAEVHRGREMAGDTADRRLIENTINQLMRWITELNVQGAKPPRFEFYEESEARSEWVESIDKAREFMDVPKAFAHERLQIPMAQAGEEVLPRNGKPSAEFKAPAGHDFKRAEKAPTSADAAADADELLAGLLEPVRDLLERVESLEDFLAGLEELMPDLDDQKLGEFTALAFMVGALNGAEEASDA